MSFCRPLISITLIALFALCVGCSGGGSPVVPSNQQAGSLDSAPIIGLSDTGDDFNAVGLLGAYELYINPDTMSVELIAKRSSAIGESWTLEGLAYFTIAPCSSCLEMVGIEWEDPYIKVSFALTHPFLPGDPGNPPTAKNRLDLDVFDVAMVIKPRETTPNSFSLGTAYGEICGDTDGYTTELADYLLDTAALPYFLVIDESDSTTPTWNKFAMGTVDATFDVLFSGGGRFDTYLTFGYGWSAAKKDRLVPRYCNPEFNKKQAWKVVATPPEGDDPPTRANTWNDIDTTTSFPVTIEVYDWQQGAVVDPALTNITDVYAASNVTSVAVEIPGMLSAPVSKTTADSGTGMPGDPLVYTFNIANTLGLSAGQYLSLVRVEDERVPQNPIVDRDYLIHSPDGVLLENYTIPAYETYQTFIATVFTGCGPITGSITTPAGPVSGVTDDTKVYFEASASSANGGDPVVLYEWDFDYDGVTFDVEGTGASICAGPFNNPNCGGTNTPVTYTVAVRATDSCVDPPNVTVFDTLDVTVDICPTSLHVQTTGTLLSLISGDTWFDVAVQSGGTGYVYIVADHPATGNTGGSGEDGHRTCLRYNNDLTGMQVVNSGTGMASPYPTSWTFTKDFHRIEVSPNGSLVNDVGGNTMATWNPPSGTPLTTSYVACCWQYACSLAMSTIYDLTDHTSAGYGTGFNSIAYLPTPCVPAFWCLGFNESNLASYSGYNTDAGTLFTNPDGIRGGNGLANSNNQAVIYTTDTAAQLAIIGSCYSQAGNLSILSSTGTKGTADGQFDVGLDVAIDSAGNILVLDQSGCNYRFQRFSSTLTFQWSSLWNKAETPMRMDYDRVDNELFLLCEEGVWKCTIM